MLASAQALQMTRTVPAQAMAEDRDISATLPDTAADAGISKRHGTLPPSQQ